MKDGVKMMATTNNSVLDAIVNFYQIDGVLYKLKITFLNLILFCFVISFLFVLQMKHFVPLYSFLFLVLYIRVTGARRRGQQQIFGVAMILVNVISLTKFMLDSNYFHQRNDLSYYI